MTEHEYLEGEQNLFGNETSMVKERLNPNLEELNPRRFEWVIYPKSTRRGGSDTTVIQKTGSVISACFCDNEEDLPIRLTILVMISMARTPQTGSIKHRTVSGEILHLQTVLHETQKE